MEFSDEEAAPHPDEAAGQPSSSTAALLDDVPLQLRKQQKPQLAENQAKRPKGPEGDPATWPLPQRRDVFEKKETATQAATQRTRQRVTETREWLQPAKKLRSASGKAVQRARSAGEVLHVQTQEAPHPMEVEGGESESMTDDEEVHRPQTNSHDGDSVRELHGGH